MYEELNRKINDSRYDEIIDYVYDIWIRNVFIQDDDIQEVSFISNFGMFKAI